jgi:hypothetical protein
LSVRNKYMKKIICIALIIILIICGGLLFKNHQDNDILKKILNINYYTSNVWDGYNFLFIDKPFLLRNFHTDDCILFSSKSEDFNEIISYKKVIKLNEGYIYRGICSDKIKQFDDYDIIDFKGKNIVSYVYYDKYSFKKDRIAFIVHENFHLYQNSRFNYNVGDKAIYNFTDVYTAENLALKQIETILLYKAISEKTNFQKYLRDFVMIRKYRYSIIKSEAKNYEEMFEKMEGTARYIENKLYNYRIKSNGLMPSELLTMESIYNANKLRDNSYYTGAAECVLMERLDIPQWQRRVENGEHPFDILSSYLNVNQNSKEIEDLLNLYNYNEILDSVKVNMELMISYLNDIYNNVEKSRYRLVLKHNPMDKGSYQLGFYHLEPLIYKNGYTVGVFTSYIFRGDSTTFYFGSIPYMFDPKENTYIVGINSLPKTADGKTFIINENDRYLRTKNTPKFQGNRVIVEL